MMDIFNKTVIVTLICLFFQLSCITRSIVFIKQEDMNFNKFNNESVILEFLEEKRRPILKTKTLYQELKKEILNEIGKKLNISENTKPDPKNNLLQIQIGIIGRKSENGDSSLFTMFASAYLVSLIPITQTKIHEFSFIVSKKEKRKVYTYYSDNRVYFGTLMIPFLWMNTFTSKPNDVIKPIIQKLFHDLQQDDFLKD
jgi:tRNA U54 and U55 pseudouridine synthase Pus10